MKKLIGIVLVSLTSLISSHAQVETIIVPTSAVLTNGFYAGGTLCIPTNSFACLKSFIGGSAYLQINSQGLTLQLGNQYIPSLVDTPIVIAGPATIQIEQSSAVSQPSAFATFSVEPGPFPPGQTATVGAYAGNVQVTMQMSTDLVNWTTAVNGQVYTNLPAARFFRIQLMTNVAP